MNNWNFTGNLGKDAESRYTPSGDAVAGFSVAVKSGYGDKALTTWVRCSLFGKRVDALMPYLKKGQLVGISGEACMRPWEDKDGAERQSLEVRVNDLTLLGKSDGGTRGAQPAPARPDKESSDTTPGSFVDLEDDIPFN